MIKIELISKQMLSFENVQEVELKETSISVLRSLCGMQCKRLELLLYRIFNFFVFVSCFDLVSSC